MAGLLRRYSISIDVLNWKLVNGVANYIFEVKIKNNNNVYSDEDDDKEVKWFVYHRYSSLSSLHDSLDDVYPNLPTFPPKVLFAFNRTKLCDERLKLFQTYVNKLIEIGICYKSGSFRHFFEIDVHFKNTMSSMLKKEDEVDKLAKIEKKEIKSEIGIILFYSYYICTECIKENSLDSYNWKQAIIYEYNGKVYNRTICNRHNIKDILINSNSEYFKMLVRYQNRLLPFQVQTNIQASNNSNCTNTNTTVTLSSTLTEQQQQIQNQKSIYGIDSNPLKNKNVRTLKEDNNTIFYNINSLLPLLTLTYSSCNTPLLYSFNLQKKQKDNNQPTIKDDDEILNEIIHLRHVFSTKFYIRYLVKLPEIKLINNSNNNEILTQIKRIRKLMANSRIILEGSLNYLLGIYGFNEDNKIDIKNRIRDCDNFCPCLVIDININEEEKSLEEIKNYILFCKENRNRINKKGMIKMNVKLPYPNLTEILTVLRENYLYIGIIWFNNIVAIRSDPEMSIYSNQRTVESSSNIDSFSTSFKTIKKSNSFSKPNSFSSSSKFPKSPITPSVVAAASGFNRESSLSSCEGDEDKYNFICDSYEFLEHLFKNNGDLNPNIFYPFSLYNIFKPFEKVLSRRYSLNLSPMEYISTLLINGSKYKSVPLFKMVNINKVEEIYEKCQLLFYKYDIYDKKNLDELLKELIKILNEAVIDKSILNTIFQILFKSSNKLFDLKNFIDNMQMIIIKNENEVTSSDILNRLFCGDISYDSESKISQSNGYVGSSLFNLFI